MDKRKCFVCGREKPISFFDEKSDTCLLCEGKKRKRYVEIRISDGKRIASLDYLKNKKTECSVSGDIEIPEFCPVLDIPLDEHTRDNLWTIDRIDNSKGYVKGNIKVISLRANRLKSDATLEEMKAIVKYMEDSI